MPRQMTMIAFLQAQNCSNLPASWRHPASAADFTSPEYYQRIGRALEDGKFHMAFFDDRLAMPDIYSGGFGQTVENGIRAVKMDLISIVTAMGMATTNLGLGATYSTTYYEPFHMPELQRRGLFRKEYVGSTLRENLGLPKPTAAECRAAGRRGT